MPQRFSHLWETLHTSFSYNKHHKNATKYLPGGTIGLSINKWSNRAFERGADDTGLGRWTWTRYSGKGNATLRVVSAYRPCPNKGPKTVYSQHLNYFYSLDQARCPREAFYEDLAAEITSWKDAKDQVIVFGDLNNDVRDDKIWLFFKNLGLRELLLEKYGDSPLPVHIRWK